MDILATNRLYWSFQEKFKTRVLYRCCASRCLADLPALIVPMLYYGAVCKVFAYEQTFLVNGPDGLAPRRYTKRMDNKYYE